MNAIDTVAGKRPLAWLAPVLALAHAASLGKMVPVDDDYIVYRYARNLLAHGEYTFNLGAELSDGVTTLGWWLLTLPAVALGVAPEVWTPLLGALAFAALSAAVSAATRRAGAGAAASVCAGLLVAASPALAWHARAGLGTVIAALLVALAAERALTSFGQEVREGQSAGEANGQAPSSRLAPASAAGWLLALGVLVRPEILVVLLGCAASRTLRRPAVLIPPLFALGLLGAWRWWMFGSVLPATAMLKALPWNEELSYGWSYALRSAREGGLALALAGGTLTFLRDCSARWLGMACAGGLAVVVATGGDWMVYDRFFIPFAPLAWIALLSWPRAWPPLALACLALAGMGFQARPQAAFENRFFERHWLEIGDELAARAPAGSSVALSPIGAIGWRSDLEVVDVLGLTHMAFLDAPPDLERVGVKGHHRHDGGWVLDQEPDYLLLGNARIQPDTGLVAINPWEADIVEDPRFASDYVTDSLQLGATGEVVPYARRRGRPRL